MKYQILAAGAALAPFVAAGNAHRCKLSLKTELEVVTVIGTTDGYAPPAYTESESTQVTRSVVPAFISEAASPSAEPTSVTESSTN